MQGQPSVKFMLSLEFFQGSRCHATIKGVALLPTPLSKRMESKSFNQHKRANITIAFAVVSPKFLGLFSDTARNVSLTTRPPPKINRRKHVIKLQRSADLDAGSEYKRASLTARLENVQCNDEANRHQPIPHQQEFEKRETADSQTSQIPPGAKVDTSPYQSRIQARLDKLTFAYETTPGTALPAHHPHGCIRYRCEHGHIVRSVLGSLSCRVCPSCVARFDTAALNTSRVKLTICQLRSDAAKRGGVLLSTEYVNAHSLLSWRCGLGHCWRATASNVRCSQSWCPECARLSRKHTIQDMRLLAKKFDGECISDQYISEHVKLQWRCQNGHTFWIAPNNVNRSETGTRRPTWCKICRRNKKKTEAESLTTT